MQDMNMGAANVLCPICGEGHVTDGMAMTEYAYKGKTTSLPLRFTTCDTCGSESAGLEESRANKRVAMAFRKSVDGLLTGAEICVLRGKYMLTQTQAAQLFGGGPVAFSKYENDDVAQSEAMDSLLRLVRRSESAFLELLAEKKMTELQGVIKPAFKSIAVTSVFSAQPDNVVEIADYKMKKMGKATAVSATYIGGQEAKLWK